jgi:hypothetical protein
MQSSSENQYFCALCKKRQKMSQQIPYFSTKIYPFYTGCTKGRILLKQLHWHLGCGDTHATFYFIFFDIFKFVQNRF